MSVRNNNSYLKSLEWFRGLAIVFVVFTHVDASSLSNISGGDYLRRFFSNGTFYFVFISGYLFWHLINKFEYKNFILSKIRNVLVPYFFILTPVLILFSVFKVIDDSPASLLNQYLVGGGS